MRHPGNRYMGNDSRECEPKDDANVYDARPLRDRPLMPNVWELAGEQRGERSEHVRDRED